LQDVPVRDRHPCQKAIAPTLTNFSITNARIVSAPSSVTCPFLVCTYSERLPKNRPSFERGTVRVKEEESADRKPHFARVASINMQSAILHLNLARRGRQTALHSPSPFPISSWLSQAPAPD
jgi:hypothetical protein